MQEVLVLAMRRRSVVATASLVSRRGLQLQQRQLLVRERTLITAATSGSGSSSSSSTTEKKKEEGASTEKKSDGGSSGTGSTAKRLAETMKEIPTKLAETVRNIVQGSEEGRKGKGETWDDAFREVFGMNRNRRKQQLEQAAREREEAEAAEKEKPTLEVLWYEATDPQTQKIYYYNDKGETKWKDELSEGEQLKIRERTPSFLEEKLKTLSAQIGELEKEREEAKSKSDMPQFKKLNAQIREMRKDVDNINARLNTTALTTVEEKKSAWQKITESVKDTRLAQEVKKLSETEAVKKAREIAEDAREVWETSQNPWIYRAHSAYDVVFSENEQAEAVKAVRKEDPRFTIENFLIECEEDLLPIYINAFLSGDKALLREMSGDTAFAFANAHIDQRIRDKRKKYPHILGLDNVRLYNFRIVDKVGPVAVVILIAHQVDVEYDFEGNIVKGDENKIEGVPYFFAFSREYDEKKAEHKWIVHEFSPSAGVAMLV